MARKTSHESWQAVQDSGLVTRMRLQVYCWLYVYGPATRSELDDGLRVRTEVNPSYHKRLSELERMGVVETVGERECHITGHNCITWDTTNLATPRPLPTARQTKSETIAKYDSLIGEVIDWLENQEGGIRKATVEAAAKKLRARRAEVIPKEGKETNDNSTERNTEASEQA